MKVEIEVPDDVVSYITEKYPDFNNGTELQENQVAKEVGELLLSLWQNTQDEAPYDLEEFLGVHYDDDRGEFS